MYFKKSELRRMIKEKEILTDNFKKLIEYEVERAIKDAIEKKSFKTYEILEFKNKNDRFKIYSSLIPEKQKLLDKIKKEIEEDGVIVTYKLVEKYIKTLTDVDINKYYIAFDGSKDIYGIQLSWD